MTRRVVLAMSGGVDSSAAALLLRRQGYDVVGLFMRSGAAEESACAVSSPENTGTGLLPIVTPRANRQGCCSAVDAADARRVADSLDIPFHALNFQDAFGRIKDYFADEYLAGRTPNPCVMCNNWLKFGKLWDFARQVGADHIATGHYARIEQVAATTDQAALVPALVRGRDRSKDQSYVLFGIRSTLLDRILFPVGGHEKHEIRELAREAGLKTAEKPDSQEICFVPDNDYAGFLQRYRGQQETSGELVDTAGNVLGQHDGYERYTIGQRKRLGITFGERRFVVGIDPDTRRVTIGRHEDLSRDILEANRLNWLVPDLPATFQCHAQIRYRHEPAVCEVERLDEDRLRVRFESPQFGVAPGQAVVLYDGDRVLGGGWICSG